MGPTGPMLTRTWTRLQRKLLEEARGMPADAFARTNPRAFAAFQKFLRDVGDRSYRRPVASWTFVDNPSVGISAHSGGLGVEYLDGYDKWFVQGDDR